MFLIVLYWVVWKGYKFFYTFFFLKHLDDIWASLEKSILWEWVSCYNNRWPKKSHDMDRPFYGQRTLSFISLKRCSDLVVEVTSFIFQALWILLIEREECFLKFYSKTFIFSHTAVFLSVLQKQLNIQVLE